VPERFGGDLVGVIRTDMVLSFFFGVMDEVIVPVNAHQFLLELNLLRNFEKLGGV